jgi:hypothetical protein
MPKRIEAVPLGRIPGLAVMSLQPANDEDFATGMVFENRWKQLADGLRLEEREAPRVGALAPE